MNERSLVSVRSLVELFRDACEESECGELVALREGRVDGDVRGFSVRISARRSFEVLVTEIHPRMGGTGDKIEAVRAISNTPRDGARRSGRGRRVARNTEAAQEWRHRTERSDSYEVSFLELFQDTCLRNDRGRIVGFREALSEATGESGFNLFTVDRRLFEVTVAEV